jgi:hypothetical protein
MVDFIADEQGNVEDVRTRSSPASPQAPGISSLFSRSPTSRTRSSGLKRLLLFVSLALLGPPVFVLLVLLAQRANLGKRQPARETLVPKTVEVRGWYDWDDNVVMLKNISGEQLQDVAIDAILERRPEVEQLAVGSRPHLENLAFKRSIWKQNETIVVRFNRTPPRGLGEKLRTLRFGMSVEEKRDREEAIREVSMWRYSVSGKGRSIDGRDISFNVSGSP